MHKLLSNDISLMAKKTRKKDNILKTLIFFCAFLTMAILFIIVFYVFYRGIPQITWEFLTTAPSTLHKTVGVLPSIINTLYMIGITLLIATPIGVGAAVYLNEYAKKGRIVRLIEFTTETLAGIPSIIYGLFGSLIFSVMFAFGYSILSGALTLTIMVLPIIVRTTQESLKTVPGSFREAALGVGSTKFYMIRTVILPSAMPGIITGIILAIGRIVGESAALIFTSGISTTMPKNFFGHIMESGATLTIYLYTSAAKGQNNIAFGIAAVLLIIVLAINLLTNYSNKKMRKI
jgi:phosphate transport system permease protein